MCFRSAVNLEEDSEPYRHGHDVSEMNVFAGDSIDSNHLSFDLQKSSPAAERRSSSDNCRTKQTAHETDARPVPVGIPAQVLSYLSSYIALMSQNVPKEAQGCKYSYCAEDLRVQAAQTRGNRIRILDRSRGMPIIMMPRCYVEHKMTSW